MREIAVVHLVRRANGPDCLARFIASYKAHAAGIDHDLILVCKGFSGRRLPADHADLLGGIRHHLLFLADRGFDIVPYFLVVQRFACAYYCFLNSFSRVLGDGWLGHLYRQARFQGNGLVSATGSYQSFARGHQGKSASERLRYVLGAGSSSLLAQRAASWMLGTVGLWQPGRYFAAFPNYHLRTNGFLGSRELLLRIRVPPMLFKLSAFMFESGRNGLTAQVLAMGLKALMVDRRGQAFDRAEWHLANAFRQSRQEDLLIADNQTDAYERATPEQRAQLSRLAWGPHARPS